MLQWHPNERLSAQECLDDPTLKLLQSKAIAMAEEQLKKAVQQLSASSSNSKANDQEEQIPTHIDTDYASNLTRDSFFDSSGNFDSGVSQYSPGAVAWRDQGVSGSRTPVPPHLRSESEYQQPIPYGLVLVGNSGNGPKSQHEVEVDEPTLKPYQRSKTGPIASCKGKGPKIRHEVEGDEPTAKPSQRSKAGSTRPRRNLQTDKVRAFSPSGLSVAGPHRTPSQRKRSSSLISKRPASSSAARHRRGSSTSEQATEQAAAHALMGLKKCTH